jgi:hypothetical protein
MSADVRALVAEAFPDLAIRSFVKMGHGKAGEIYLANDEIVFKVPLVGDPSRRA